MDIKTLKQAKNINREITSLLSEKEQLYNMLKWQGDTTHIKGLVSEYEEAINRELLNLLRAKKEVSDGINKLDDYSIRAVLRGR